jgi:hypothetical protein
VLLADASLVFSPATRTTLYGPRFFLPQSLYYDPHVQLYYTFMGIGAYLTLLSVDPVTGRFSITMSDFPFEVVTYPFPTSYSPTNHTYYVVLDKYSVFDNALLSLDPVGHVVDGIRSLDVDVLQIYMDYKTAAM